MRGRQPALLASTRRERDAGSVAEAAIAIMGRYLPSRRISWSDLP
jgi:hypothetical protein